MGSLVLYMFMSLDGFIAGPDDRTGGDGGRELPSTLNGRITCDK
jgi:hypothetical protein